MISQTDLLRLRQSRGGGGKSINTAEAKAHDVKVRDVMGKLCVDLGARFPEKKIEIRKSISQEVIAHTFNPEYRKSNPKSSIRPDGGVLFIDDKPVLSTEAKKQGTNALRRAEGLKKQAMGNAIERAHKNYNEIKNLFHPYPYTGYILFGYGCDFQPGSSIVDRLSAMTYYDRFNTLHIKDSIINTQVGDVVFTERNKKASVYLQVEPFTFDFMYDVCLKAVQEIMELEIFKSSGVLDRDPSHRSAGSCSRLASS